MAGPTDDLNKSIEKFAKELQKQHQDVVDAKKASGASKKEIEQYFRWGR